MSYNKQLRNKRTETQKRNASNRPMVTERNRKRKLMKHSSLHPKDIQALQKLKWTLK